MTPSLSQEFLAFIDDSATFSTKVLAERVLKESRRVTNAEAGSIFIVRGRGAKRQLEAVSLQNDAITTSRKLFVIPVTPASIAGYVATIGQMVFVDDVDHLPEDVPYRFNRDFDQKSGYRTRSVMCFPLKTPEGRVIGVVQLINRLVGPEEGRIAKPFLRSFTEIIGVVSLLVGRAIERIEALEQIRERNKRLTERNRELKAERRRVLQLSEETDRALMLSVELLARAAEVHDGDISSHIQRVNEYSYLMAQLAGRDHAFCDEIRWAAALHDVGKMSVDQAVLHKPGKLDEREWVEMKAHTTHGMRILNGHPRLAMACDIAYCHHEMWAGGGYPRGLAGEAIPIEARIVALADVYDALRSERPYKPAYNHDRAIEIMLHGDERMRPESHFDPTLLALFGKHHQRFADLWTQMAEHAPGPDATARAG
ncbi:MAG TPA: HD domain-containing phosphohydrolase [Aliidongia sp.]|uniref:GAF and HD-GYP domain-containing protein n=1 Tax=Aliidongia sp. TaxID=1914230 RepID=UPI002DDD63BD|nr:HD domain-containing phosphohydrolase [Aliidongia sp.]HEV2678362.1 HD domain-containing phosphohydrolase [Aliidongia sp.]